MNGVVRSVAVLMTCHNRRESTLRCLRRLKEQTGVELVQTTTFLVDDGSTDGTSEAVRAEFPDTHIIAGDGSLYWTGGMRRAMDAALDEDFDFYLWLNDDTELYRDALARILTAHEVISQSESTDVLVVGSAQDPVTGELTYGGAVRASWWHPLRFKRIAPAMDTPRPCDVMNGNFVLISRAAGARIGNLHPALRHTSGDYDYALRAARLGVPSWIAPGYYGTCARNTVTGSWREPGLSLIGRYRRLLGPKGHPMKPRAVYMAEHGGLLWPLLFATVYLTLPIRHVAAYVETRWMKSDHIRILD